MNTVSASLVRPRGWSGPACLFAAPLLYWLGDILLNHQPVTAFSLTTSLGLLLVFTSPLALVAGIGESANWLRVSLRR